MAIVNETNYLARSLVAFFLLIGLGFVLLISVLVAGAVTGEEFAPQSFSKRRFTYYRFPIVKMRVTKTTLDSLTGTLVCSSEISKHLATSIGAGTVRWDLGEHSIGGSNQPSGEAQVLLEYIDSSRGKDFWGDWSKDNAPLAAVLWPAVQQLAIQHAYFAIPDLMQAAEAASQPKELQEKIKSISHSAAEILAARYDAAGDKESARIVVEWGLELGDSEELKRWQKSLPPPAEAPESSSSSK